MSDDHRVMVLGLNYPPEPTGISPYTGSMARGLARRGFSTRVITTHPHYPDWKVKPGYGEWSRSEHLDGVDVRRVRHYIPATPKGLKRVASEASFGCRIGLSRWDDVDAIVAVSPALISSSIAAFRAKITHRNVPLIVWVQDLYTIGLSETGQGGGAVLKAMSMIEGWLLRRADKVVVIHERFVAHVERFGVPRRRIEVIRNWTHLKPAPVVDVPAARARFGWEPGTTIVLHAGNMGVKQGLDNVLAAARLAVEQNTPVKFVLLGDGSERRHLEASAAGLASVQFMEPLDDHDFPAALASADCLLVNERPGVSEMAVPSKLTSYFSAGRPVVAATDVTGITAEEVRTADAGVVIPSGDPYALLNAAIGIAADPEGSRRLGANGRFYRNTVLDEDSAIDRFTEMLTRLIDRDESVTTGALTR
jgi:glycosyltransferase involved in cell wall biosynthesis